MPGLPEKESFTHSSLRGSGGLFQQKRSATAPGSLQQEATREQNGSHYENRHRNVSRDSCQMSLRSGVYEEREVARFEDKIAEYNRRAALEVFKLTPVAEKDCADQYEGAVRFYVNDDKRKLSKALRMRNTDTVAKLLPVIREKFDFSEVQSIKQLKILQVTDKEETILRDEDRPLQIAIDAGQPPRYVIRLNLVSGASAQHKLASEDVKRSYITEKGLGLIGRQPAFSSTRCTHSPLSSNSDSSFPEHLCSHHSSIRSTSGHQRRSSGRDKIRPLSRSKSEGRYKQTRPDSIAEQIQERMMERKGSRGQQPMADKENAEYSTPAAKLIESRRRKKRDRSLDEKASLDRRPGSLRNSRSKSVSNIFQKTFSLRKKDHPMLPRTELSTEDTPPGVLRIFGPAISPGTQYKSVLASSNSTAEELVKEALDRYTISRDYARHFVLCDVIGQFILPSGHMTDNNRKTEGIWQEECIRIIGDNERPLILQSFWKPSEGFSRRFELRNRGEFVSVENFEYRPYANNNNANMEQNATQNHPGSDSGSSPTKRAKSSHIDKQSSQDLESSVSSAADLALIHANMRELVENDTDFEASHQGNTYKNLQNSSSATFSSQTQQTWGGSLGESVTGGDTTNITRMTHDTPFIMTLKGFEPQKDNLVHFLNKKTTVIGCDMLKLGADDICLPATDILSHHCRVNKGEDSQCAIEPFQGALVKINNRPILQNTPVLPGDVVSLGNHYIFMFRNPTIEKNIDQSNFALVKLLNGGSLESDPRFYYPGNVPSTPVNEMKQTPDPPATPETEESKQVVDWRKRKLEEYESDNRRLKLPYMQDKEDELLQRILSIIDWHSGLYKLAPCYLLSMCLEYASVRFEQVHTRQLLLKIASRVQSTVLDRTKILADRQNDLSAHPAEAMEELLPDIRSIVLWLSNSLEILHFLQTRMREYLLDPATSLPAETRMSIASAEDEVLAVLEDVVMYTFQQTVYYITKTLYAALRSILESNPFHDEDSNGDRSGMDTLLSIFQTTLHTLLEYNSHPQILSQMFCYLFFFTDTTLINTLLTNDGAERYYKWSSGVRLRGNLDVLEGWACDNHLQEEASKHLQKLNNMVDLLATPKVQLQQADWSTLRADYPHLSPSQLHYILTKYTMTAGKQRPEHWQPTEEDCEQAFSEDALHESFTNHPALVLPTKGFTLDLSRDVADSIFYDVLSELVDLFGDSQAEENGSGYLSEEEYSREISIAARKSQHISVPPQQHHQPRFQAARPELSRPNEEPPALPKSKPPVPWYQQNSSPTEQKVSPWSNKGSQEQPQFHDSGFSSYKMNHSQEYLKKNCSENSKSDRTNALAYPEAVHNRNNPINSLHSRDGSNRSGSSEGHVSSRNSSNGSREKLRDSGYSQKKTTQHRFVYDFEENFMTEAQQKDENVSVHTNGVTQKLLNTNTGPALMTGPTADTGTETEDPLYMNIEEFHEKEKMSINLTKTIPGVPSSRTFTTDPLAMSTPMVSSESSANTSPNDVTRRRYSQKSAMNTSKFEPPGKPKPISQVPQSESHTAGHKQFVSPSDENVVEVEQNTLSPRATLTGLRVLPLTTDDQKKKPENGSRPDQRFPGNSAAVTESEMDQILHNKSRQENAKIARALEANVRHSDDVFVVELEKTERGLGLGLIDGLYTPHRQAGIYVRTLVQGGAASVDGRVRLGDRILAVNGHSVVGADYLSAMKLIKNSGHLIKFLVAKSDRKTAMQISASSC